MGSLEGSLISVPLLAMIFILVSLLCSFAVVAMLLLFMLALLFGDGFERVLSEVEDIPIAAQSVCS